jgi:hypothetical protein
MAPKKTYTPKDDRSFAHVGLLVVIAIILLFGVLILGVG